MITKTYDNISKEEFLTKYFKLVGFFDPTKIIPKKLVIVLIEFLLLEGDIYKHARFAKKAKLNVIKKLKEKYEWDVSLQNMVVKLLEFERMGYIQKDEDGVKYFHKEHQKVIDKIFNSKEMVDINFRFRIKK